MNTMDEGSVPRCTFCGEEHPLEDRPGRACEALRAAAEKGAQPPGVPVRVQAAYVEARQALRADAPAVAIRVLSWLLSHLAETRGASPSLSLSAKIDALSMAGVISPTIRPGLLAQARAGAPGHENAWALMTLTEHALTRAYMRRTGA